MFCAAAGDVAPVSRLSPCASVRCLSIDTCFPVSSRVTTARADGLSAVGCRCMRRPASAEPLVVLGRALGQRTMSEAARPSSSLASANASKSTRPSKAVKSPAFRRSRPCRPACPLPAPMPPTASASAPDLAARRAAPEVGRAYLPAVEEEARWAAMWPLLRAPNPERAFLASRLDRCLFRLATQCLLAETGVSCCSASYFLAIVAWCFISWS